MKLDYIKLLVENSVGLNISKKSSKTPYVHARWIYFTLAKQHTKKSLSSIAKLVNKDHATVLHGIKRIEIIKTQSKDLLINYNKCKNIILSALDNGFEDIEDIEVLKIEFKNKIESQKIKYSEEIQALKDELLLSNINNIKRFKNPHLVRLINSDDETISIACETRLEPFFKMLDSRITHADILSKRKKSIYS